MLERYLEFPGAAIEEPFFADECLLDCLTLALYQQAQAGLSIAEPWRLGFDVSS